MNIVKGIEIAMGLSFLGLVLVGFSPQNKNGALDCQPAVNFKGKITSLCQKDPINVEKITIGGDYEGIKIYAVTCSDDLDPVLNSSKLSLRDVKSLNLVDLASDNPIARMRKFKNREYIQIDIEWKNNSSKDSYLIESNSMIICVEKKDKISLKKEIGFKGLVKLEIDGWIDEKMNN